MKKAGGSDEIPTRIYVELADFIAKPLSIIFKQSCIQRRFPDFWKRGIVIPLPKSSPPDITKLRYITLLPVPSKIFESLVMKRLKNTFETAFGPEQHGFRRNASTTTALLKIVHTASKIYDNPSMFGTAILSYDLSSAFDCVNHHLSVENMRQMCFPNGFLQWLSCYLSNRKSVVRLNGKLSKPINIERGVPQGSVLGPSIFCTYVSNFSPLSSTVNVVKYADDFSLILPLESRSEEDIQTLINEETDNLSQWCVEKKLQLNLSKSSCLLATRQCINLPNLTIRNLESTRILGVHLNNKLNWKCHVLHLRKVCSQRLHILRRLRALSVPQASLTRVYYAIIRSVLEYSSPLFVGLNKKHSKVLQRIEKRALKIISPDSSCEEQDSVSSRRLMLSSKLWHKIECNQSNLLHLLIPRRLSRSQKYFVEAFRSDKFGKTFFPFMTLTLNNDSVA